MSKLDADGESDDQKLIQRLKRDIEHKERIIGALLDQMYGDGRAGSMVTITKAAYLRPWRRVFVSRIHDTALRIAVWHQRLRPPFRGGDEQQIPSEPLPWDETPLPGDHAFRFE